MLYTQPMPITTLLFDLDDTLYSPTSGMWELIGNRIELFIHTKLHFPVEEVHSIRQRLFKEYGTTMRGLIELYQIDAEEYLKFVHDVPVEELISPDPELNWQLSCLPQKKVIFTNADDRHAKRVLCALNLEDIFEKIIDIRSVAPYCKPQPEAYHLALKCLDEVSANNCLVIDDSPRNLETAQALGFHTLLIGSPRTPAAGENRIQAWKELPLIISRLEG
jgi:putative hydrolase of the HAD superfamily